MNSFRCKACGRLIEDKDWCVIRDKASEHLRICAPLEIIINTPSGIITFKSEAENKRGKKAVATAQANH